MKPQRQKISNFEILTASQKNAKVLKQMPGLPSSKTCKQGALTYNSAIFLFLAILFLSSCNPDHPNFEPSYSGAPPEEDLDQYLDTKAVFEDLDQVKGVRNQLDSLLTLTDKLKHYDESIAMVYADSAYRMATKKNWQLSRGIATYYIALLKGRREKYGEGIEDAMVEAEISKLLLSPFEGNDWQIKVDQLLGNFYYRLSMLDSAKIYLIAAQEKLKKSDIPDADKSLLQAELFHDLGNIYVSLDSVMTDSFYQESGIFYQLSGHSRGKTSLCFDMARRYALQEDFVRADALIHQGIAYAEKDQNIFQLIRGYQGLGILRIRQYRHSGDEKYAQEAQQYFGRCLQIQTEDRYFLFSQIGQNYQQRAYHSNDEREVYAFVDSAIVAYKSAMEEARKDGVLIVMELMGRNISRLCSWRSSSIGRDCSDLLGTSSADFLNANYAGLTDTIGQILQSANQRNRAFERRSLEAENKRIYQLQLYRLQLIIGGAGLLIVILLLNLSLQKQKRKGLQAKLEALRAQINPHFIANSLNAIESLVNLDQKDAAAKYIIHFSRLSRNILKGSREGITSLSQEIDTLRHFLHLEQLRFRDKLQFQIEIEGALNPKEIEIPAMILQPYVENAICHGIKPKLGNGLVKVLLRRDANYLICEVEDNGVGRAKAADLKASSILQEPSLSMDISRERLEVLGQAAGASVLVIDLFDGNGEASGTKVVLKIPFKTLNVTARAKTTLN